MNTTQFRKKVLNYHQKYGRDLPWRHPSSKLRAGKQNLNPYHILVSEIMLQQTQVSRVIPKYREFIQAFPTIQSLNRASLRSVLRVWQGLGYNRRALSLKLTAKEIVKNYSGKIPKTIEELVALPGIGHATAAAILVYTYNVPLAFIETNIRTVFIHHFFSHQNNVADKVIEKLVTKTLDQKNPRVWYWALMDYGSHIKKKFGNVSQKSAQHIKQLPFKGSIRELRGAIIRMLINRKSLTKKEIDYAVSKDASSKQLSSVLKHLKNEGLISLKNKRYGVSNT